MNKSARSKIIEETKSFVYYSEEYEFLKSYENEKITIYKDPWWTLRFLTAEEKAKYILRNANSKIGVVLTSGKEHPEESAVLKRVSNEMLKDGNVHPIVAKVRKYLAGPIPSSLRNTLYEEIRRQEVIRSNRSCFESQESREAFLIKRACEKLIAKYPYLRSKLDSVPLEFVEKGIIGGFIYPMHSAEKVVFIKIDSKNTPVGILVVSQEYLDYRSNSLPKIWKRAKGLPFEPLFINHGNKNH